MLRTRMKPTGILKVKIYEHGILAHQFRKENLVVAGGRDAMVQLLAVADASDDKRLVEFGAGTSSTPTSLSDTALTGAFTKALDATSYPSAGVAQFNFNIDETENNGMAISEFGLFCVDGTLFNRIVVGTINKTSAIRIEATWQIVF